MQFAAAIAAAAAGDPMTQGPAVKGRVLLVDGDGLAYFCAGNDSTDQGRARRNVIEKLENAKRAGAAEETIILLTSQASHKGYRYAVARAKPYQGHRSGGRRPKNWHYLRQLLEAGLPGVRTEIAAEAEADDLFGRFSSQLGWDNVVIHTDDKDMRMVPGIHVDWHSMRVTRVEPGTWESRWDDLVFGRKWFWLQMLQGDTADNVPGLPKCVVDGKVKQCGPKTAEAILAKVDIEALAYATVEQQYRLFYGEAWPEAMLEQAVLLWMRRDPLSKPFDCLSSEYGPMALMADEDRARALGVLKMRIAEAACAS